MRIVSFEVVDHGLQHAQYFQGCGLAFSRFNYDFGGVGTNRKEALENAIECLAQSLDVDCSCLDSHPWLLEGPTVEDHFETDSEWHYYVTLLVETTDD